MWQWKSRKFVNFWLSLQLSVSKNTQMHQGRRRLQELCVHLSMQTKRFMFYEMKSFFIRVRMDKIKLTSKILFLKCVSHFSSVDYKLQFSRCFFEQKKKLADILALFIAKWIIANRQRSQRLIVIQLISIEQTIGLARDPFLGITRKFQQQPFNWNHARRIFKKMNC